MSHDHVHSCERLHTELGGVWTHVRTGDTDVYTDGQRVAKLGRTDDAETRMRRGVVAANLLGTRGVRCVAPTGSVTYLDGRPMTLWPYVAHTPVTAATLDPDTAASVGDLFASIGEVPATERRAPFDRIPARLARLRPGTPERDLVNGIVAELEQRLAPLLTGKLAAAHGDPSVDNLLITDTGPTLIDLDSFAAMPDGWDLACLRLHLQRKHGNSAAWQALMGRYRETRAVPDGAVLDVLEQAKAVMGATFAATFELDDGQKQRLRTQLVELHRWVTGGQEPQRLTLIG